MNVFQKRLVDIPIGTPDPGCGTSSIDAIVPRAAGTERQSGFTSLNAVAAQKDCPQPYLHLVLDACYRRPSTDPQSATLLPA